MTDTIQILDILTVPPPFVLELVPVPPTPPKPPRPGRSAPLVPRDPRAPTKRLREHTEVVASMLNSLIGGGYIQLTTDNNYCIFGGPFVESRPPGVGDDTVVGVVVGGVWVDTSASPRDVYICTDDTAGAATWKLIT